MLDAEDILTLDRLPNVALLCESPPTSWLIIQYLITIMGNMRTQSHNDKNVKCLNMRLIFTKNNID